MAARTLTAKGKNGKVAFGDASADDNGGGGGGHMIELAVNRTLACASAAHAIAKLGDASPRRRGAAAAAAADDAPKDCELVLQVRRSVSASSRRARQRLHTREPPRPE